MVSELDRQIRQNRVKAMAITGASPDAWAEVLLLPDEVSEPRQALAHLQAWCWRAAEDAENRRVIERAEQWASSLVDSAAKAHRVDGQTPSPNLDDRKKLQEEVAWVEAQFTQMPPPDRSPEWTLHITLLDLVCYSVVEPHAGFTPIDWLDLVIELLQSKSQTAPPTQEGLQNFSRPPEEVLTALNLSAEEFEELMTRCQLPPSS